MKIPRLIENMSGATALAESMHGTGQEGKSLLANTPAEHPDSIGTPARRPLL